MMKWLVLSSLILVTACASRPTPYGPAQGRFGHVIEDTSSTFTGNEHTTSRRTFHYSQLAAIESCYNKRMLTFLHETITESDKASETKGTGFMTKARYEGMGGAAVPTPQTTTTLEHPRSITTFRCAGRIQALRDVTQMMRVPSEKISATMKDGLGGVLINEVTAPGTLQSKDIIIQANNMRIDKEDDLIQHVLFNQKKIGPVPLKIIRNGVIKAVNAPVIDISKKILILNFYETQKACSQRKKNEPVIPLCEKTRSDWEQQIQL